MALDIDAKLQAFLASAPQNKRSIQVLRFSHSQMSRVWTLWREPYHGAVVTTDDGLVTAEPANIEIGLSSSDQTLDQTFTITLGTVDIDDLFRDEIDAIDLDTSERVQIIYYEFLSDDLENELIRAVLQLEAVTFDIGAASMTAISPRLNVNRTGELYITRDVPMMRGFL